MTELIPLTQKQEKERAYLGLTHAQYQFYKDPARFRVFIAGRRVGKSTVICHEVLRAAQLREEAVIGIICPTLKQARSTIWEELKKVVPPDAIKPNGINETHMKITLKLSGSSIKVFGADRPEGIRGHTFSFCAFDEVSDIPAEVWYVIVRPTLSTTKGEAILCGTPKGHNWVKDLFDRASDPNNKTWSAHIYTTLQGGLVPEDELAEARESMSPRQFRQEFESDFLEASARVYTYFLRASHVSDRAIDDGVSPIIVGSDQNVNPYSIILMQKRIDDDGVEKMFIFDEIMLVGGNTQEAIQELKYRYHDGKKWTREIIMCPDPSCRQRRTSSTSTDFQQFLAAGLTVKAPARTQPVKDRINTVQALLKNDAGQIRLLIHPKCRETIDAFEKLQYVEGTQNPQKGVYDHAVDAAGYACMMMMPMIVRKLGMAKLRGV